jgi:hypothetical protein
MTFAFSDDHLRKIREHPHLIGHMVGKDRLTELHGEWIKYIWDSEEPIRCLQGHRGSYKTTGVTEIGCVYWLLFHPDDRIAIIRKPYTEAARILRVIKEYFKREVIQALFQYAHKVFPRFILHRDNGLLFSFKQTETKEGSIDAYGVFGNITGNHYDKIMGDDFVTLKDRVSRADRERTKDFIREVITNIIDPGKQCGFVGTPWHKQDAWSILPEPLRYDVTSTGILSQFEIEEKKKRTTKILYACNYLLRHIISDDAIFKEGNETDKWSWKCPSVYAHLDAKYKGSCTNALTIAGNIGGDQIQMTGWVFEEHIKEKTDWIIDKLVHFRVTDLYNEENPDKGFAADMFRDRIRERRAAGETISLKIHSYHESMNKHIKIVTYLKAAWSDVYWYTKTDEDYLGQILDYEEGSKPDDAPDSAASLIRQVFHPKDSNKSLWEM